ncbi:hypothetical protein GGP41_009315 [Bipolaris sorokiniana]|uniref:Uncharacterized protein n=1 Tax=Cochliobolus sativus TaxID=45130 RepID=A0A8H5ZF09_COCSA|nr:hypothetical protein GGP41_009315 [Bipolaris sorokiniana]
MQPFGDVCSPQRRPLVHPAVLPSSTHSTIIVGDYMPLLGIATAASPQLNRPYLHTGILGCRNQRSSGMDLLPERRAGSNFLTGKTLADLIHPHSKQCTPRSLTPDPYPIHLACSHTFLRLLGHSALGNTPCSDGPKDSHERAGIAADQETGNN